MYLSLYTNSFLLLDDFKAIRRLRFSDGGAGKLLGGGGGGLLGVVGASAGGSGEAVFMNSSISSWLNVGQACCW